MTDNFITKLIYSYIAGLDMKICRTVKVRGLKTYGQRIKKTDLKAVVVMFGVNF